MESSTRSKHKILLVLVLCKSLNNYL